MTLKTEAAELTLPPPLKIASASGTLFGVKADKLEAEKDAAPAKAMEDLRGRPSRLRGVGGRSRVRELLKARESIEGKRAGFALAHCRARATFAQTHQRIAALAQFRRLTLSPSAVLKKLV